MKIGIIDTGLSEKQLLNLNIKKYENLTSSLSNEDTIGHGTLIYNLYNRYYPNGEYYIVKSFSNDVITVENLINSLKFFLKKENHVDILSLSNGTKTYSEDLKKTITSLVNSGTIIIAGVDYFSYESYPAFFGNVIGICCDDRVQSYSQYITLNNSPINLLVYKGKLLLKNFKGDFQYFWGSSYQLPRIGGKIAKYIEDREDFCLSDIKKMLCNNSMRTIEFNDKSLLFLNNQKDFYKSISKIIIIGTGKEAINTIHYINKKIKLLGIYDEEKSLNIGKDLSTLLNKDNLENNMAVNFISNINWNDDFDTVIVSHLKNIDIWVHKLISLAKQYNKKIYFFDNINTVDYNNCLTPYIEPENIDINNLGRLHYFNKPVLGIVGTGKRQGKFTLQMNLSKYLSNLGYLVGKLGTEPNSMLLGMDAMIANGFGNDILLENAKEVFLANTFLSTMNSYDLVIVGTQSQILPFDYGNLNGLQFRQTNILLGTMPDCVVLVVNLNENIMYINRIISYVESFFNAKVICTAVFPKEKGVTHSHNSMPSIEKFIEILKIKTNRPSYRINDIKKISNKVIEFF